MVNVPLDPRGRLGRHTTDAAGRGGDLEAPGTAAASDDIQAGLDRDRLARLELHRGEEAAPAAVGIGPHLAGVPAAL